MKLIATIILSLAVSLFSISILANNCNAEGTQCCPDLAGKLVPEDWTLLQGNPGQNTQFHRVQLAATGVICMYTDEVMIVKISPRPQPYVPEGTGEVQGAEIASPCISIIACCPMAYAKACLIFLLSKGFIFRLRYSPLRSIGPIRSNMIPLLITCWSHL